MTGEVPAALRAADHDGAVGARGPRVSVVVPVYRVREHVEACMRSIADQTAPPAEVLLVDDRGGDDSVALAVAALRARGVEPRVLVHEANRGLGAARNTGLAAATGDVVWFFDSDDVAEPELLATLLPLLADGAALAVCRTLRVDLAGAPLGVDEEAYPVGPCTGEELARLLLEGRVRGYAWNKLFRRDALPVDPFPVGVAYEDLPAVLAIALAATRVALTDAVLYRYRQNPASISHRFGEHTLDLLHLGDAVSALLEAAGPEGSWRGPRARHLVRDVVLPLANTALLHRERARAAGVPLDAATAALVELAVAGARSRVRAGDVLALLRGGAVRSWGAPASGGAPTSKGAVGAVRLLMAAAVLRLSPVVYAALLRRSWRTSGVSPLRGG